MTYRDAAESLRARRARLAAAVDEAVAAARELTEHAARARELEKELAETDALLRKAAGPRALPLLEEVHIAAPCPARWEDMVGDERVRFCRSCEKDVFNLSAMPRAEAEALLVANDGRMCVRLYKRADGTVLTADCPVGVRRRRRRRVAAGVLGGSLLAAAAATYADGAAPGTSTLPVATMGEPTALVDPTPVIGSAAPTPPPPPDPHTSVLGRVRRR
jgi:hypothetical protein